MEKLALEIDESPSLASEELATFLSAAIDAARAAGDVIREGALNRASLDIERKTVNDFVSVIDKRAERVIIDTLAARFPDHAFKAEESGDTGTSRYTWVIDPLDGTTNFLHGIPYYCVSIALQIGDTVVVGVVFDPTSGRLFTATRGHGAFLDGKRIHVSGRPGLTEAVLGTGLPFKDWHYLDDYLASLRVIMQLCAGIRRPGAAALDLAYVSAGWTDGHWEKGLNPWDVAAGSLLV
ncbi:MAG: inositol monophosphatase family protein, partial [Casimicrobiaceae bacterium]